MRGGGGERKRKEGGRDGGGREGGIEGGENFMTVSYSCIVHVLCISFPGSVGGREYF